MRHPTRSAAIASCVIALATLAAPASARVNPAENQESTWEQDGQYDCTKVEYTDGTTTVDVPDGAAFIVVKAGTTVTQVWAGGVFAGTKDVSFVITCSGEPDDEILT